MKHFVLTEQQLQDISGRIDTLVVSGIQNIACLAEIIATLETVVQQSLPPAEIESDEQEHST